MRRRGIKKGRGKEELDGRIKYKNVSGRERNINGSFSK